MGHRQDHTVHIPDIFRLRQSDSVFPGRLLYGYPGICNDRFDAIAGQPLYQVIYFTVSDIRTVFFECQSKNRHTAVFWRLSRLYHFAHCGIRYVRRHGIIHNPAV